MTCLLCQHFAPIADATWKPGYEGDRYDRYNVRNLIQETRKHVKAWCTLNPKHVEIWSNHTCGQFVSVQTQQHDRRLEEFIWGDDRYQQVVKLKEQVKKLKAELKTARAISRKRLEQIKGNASTTTTETTPP
jgi:hypothetical protein